MLGLASACGGGARASAPLHNAGREPIGLPAPSYAGLFAAGAELHYALEVERVAWTGGAPTRSTATTTCRIGPVSRRDDAVVATWSCDTVPAGVWGSFVLGGAYIALADGLWRSATAPSDAELDALVARAAGRLADDDWRHDAVPVLAADPSPGRSATTNADGIPVALAVERAVDDGWCWTAVETAGDSDAETGLCFRNGTIVRATASGGGDASYRATLTLRAAP